MTYEETSLLKGDFEITLGNTWLYGSDLGGSEADDYLYGSAELQLGMNFGDHYFVQVDLLGEATDVNSDDTYDDGVLFAAHLMRRNSERGGLGLFGGAYRTDQDNDSAATSERYFLGLEGQVYSRSATFFGQVGYLGGDGGADGNGLDSIREAVFARSGVQYFLNEDFMLEAEISGASGEMDSDDDDASVLAWGVKAEKKLTPRLSGALGYHGAYYQQDQENDFIDEHMAYLSFTILFDKGTLQARSRNSSSLDTPQLLRWSGQTGGPLE